jgi:hypothetical protein
VPWLEALGGGGHHYDVIVNLGHFNPQRTPFAGPGGVSSPKEWASCETCVDFLKLAAFLVVSMWTVTGLQVH